MKKSGTNALRVLVIDDDEDLSAVIVDALRDQGITAWSIRPVPSSPVESVVTTAVWFKPHVILVDVVMPVNTARLVTALRDHEALAGVTLFGCSGHAALASSFSKHLDGFIHKPFSMRELGEMMAAAIPVPAASRRNAGASGRDRASTRRRSRSIAPRAARRGSSRPRSRR